MRSRSALWAFFGLLIYCSISIAEEIVAINQFEDIVVRSDRAWLIRFVPDNCQHNCDVVDKIWEGTHHAAPDLSRATVVLKGDDDYNTLQAMGEGGTIPDIKLYAKKKSHGKSMKIGMCDYFLQEFQKITLVLGNHHGQHGHVRMVLHKAHSGIIHLLSISPIYYFISLMYRLSIALPKHSDGYLLKAPSSDEM